MISPHKINEAYSKKKKLLTKDVSLALIVMGSWANKILLIVMKLMLQRLMLNLKSFNPKYCLFVSRKDFIVVSIKHINGHWSGNDDLLVTSSA